MSWIAPQFWNWLILQLKVLPNSCRIHIERQTSREMRNYAMQYCDITSINEGWILPWIMSEDKARVREDVSIVMSCLNELVSDEQ
jgi:hypothetical protein